MGFRTRAPKIGVGEDWGPVHHSLRSGEKERIPFGPEGTEAKLSMDSFGERRGKKKDSREV